MSPATTEPSRHAGCAMRVCGRPVSGCCWGNCCSAGVTGNVLPNNNEMGGRSGEGRSGRSQGEFVGDNAVGKGGRNTPTRLDPTPFQQGQVNDTSKDPVGGATGG